MDSFKLKPTIERYETFADFTQNSPVGEGDLVFLSGRFLASDFSSAIGEKAKIVDCRKYGEGEADDKTVAAIAEEIKGVNYSKVIAVGGGAIINIAKLFALNTVLPVEKLFKGETAPKKQRELIVIPTTCGSGGEMTDLSVLYFTQRETRLALISEEICPDKAVLIPELLKGLPFDVFATSSLDALIRAAEAYVSPKAGAFSKLHSRVAIETILKGYKLLRPLNEEQREEKKEELLPKFQFASSCSGIAAANGHLAAVQAISCPIGEKYKVTHGEANYIIFTEVFRTYTKVKPNGSIKELNEIFADILGCSYENVYDCIDELLQSILPKKALPQCGVVMSDVDDFAKNVTEQQQALMANSYINMDYKAVKKIYINLM